MDIYKKDLFIFKRAKRINNNYIYKSESRASTVRDRRIALNTHICLPVTLSSPSVKLQMSSWLQIWNRTGPRALVPNQHTSELISARKILAQKRPESPTVTHSHLALKRSHTSTTTKTWAAYVTLTWHACKYKVHKLHQRCILCTSDVPLVEFLYACQVRVIVGDSGLCCACVTSFEHWLTPLRVELPSGLARSKTSRWIGSGDSSVVRAPDSWLKCRGFESLQERRDKFLPQGQFSVLTLISSFFAL